MPRVRAEDIIARRVAATEESIREPSSAMECDAGDAPPCPPASPCRTCPAPPCPAAPRGTPLFCNVAWRVAKRHSAARYGTTRRTVVQCRWRGMVWCGALYRFMRYLGVVWHCAGLHGTAELGSQAASR